MKRIIISRTDAIGDVVLTLPLCGLIKKKLGNDVKIIFFGKTYTQPVIELSSHVDAFLNFDTFEKLNANEQTKFIALQNADAIIHVFPRRAIATAAKRAKIPLRVGTSHRMYHLLTCNKLLNFSRKNADLHEAQLNVKLLEGIGINLQPTLQDLISYYGLKLPASAPTKFDSILNTKDFKLILHPKSHGSAREWGLDNFKKVITLLLPYPVSIFISGSEKERELLKDWVTTLPQSVTDVSGAMTLEELISFINACDGMVAASTGPLHIAAALNKHVIGIYPPIKPMHPTRWAPVGLNATYLCDDKNCSACKNAPAQCSCMHNVSPALAADRILSWIKK